ncbi:MAG: chemotaxis protein CheW [Symbiobacteriia bacterium]
MIEDELQLVVFRLGSEYYGVDISLVRGVETLSAITRIPRTPAHIKGVINLRGRVIPVVDLKMALGLPQQGSDEAKIAVIEAEGQTIGVVVDGVSEVATITPEQVDPPTTVANGVEVEYILGVARLDNRLVTLLDLGKVLLRTERAENALVR